MPYTLYSKKTGKKAHPGTPAPTYKTRAEVERWRQYQAKGLPSKVKRTWLTGTVIKKTKSRKKRTTSSSGWNW